MDHVGLKIGVGTQPDFSALEDLVEEDFQAGGVKVSAKRKKLLQSSLATRIDCANPVVNKLYKPGKAESDPQRGLYEIAEEGKPAVVACEADPDLCETEHVPLLEQGA